MKTGGLFEIITVSTQTTSLSKGDVTETWSTPVQRRAKVVQVDGTRYLSAGELVDKEVYEVELWDESWSSNIRVVYLTKTLYPIRPVLRNPDRSMRSVVKIVMATKV